MRVFTKNSVYTITPDRNLFKVERTADAWGRAVKDRHTHYATRINVGVGGPLITSNMVTSEVIAVLA
jgi:hypothetical protein